MGKVFHANRNDKKARVAILISEEISFIPRAIMKDRDRHYIMIKSMIQEEDIVLVNIYAPNPGTSIYKANNNRYKGRNWQ